MRTVSVGTRNYTEVVCLDEPGQGGACHEYLVLQSVTHVDNGNEQRRENIFAKVSFQNGPIKEFGVNGCHNEDLIAIVIDRLEHFQKGEFSCRENALALTKLEEAMHWLRHRTNARIARGVEGTNQK